MAIMGGLAAIGGVMIGFLTHAAIASAFVFGIGVLTFVAGIRGRWRGNRILTELRQKAATGPLHTPDLLPWLDLRPAIGTGIGIGLVLAVVWTVIVIVLFRH